MRAGITFEVTAADRTRLEAISADRNCPQKHVWRANIVLLTSAGCGTAEIMRRTGKAKTCVWRWQERYMQEGVDGLLRDKTRPSRKPPLQTVARVVDLTLGRPPGEALRVKGRIAPAFSEKTAMGSISRLDENGAARKPAGPLATRSRDRHITVTTFLREAVGANDHFVSRRP
jgi:hypothetical protein